MIGAQLKVLPPVVVRSMRDPRSLSMLVAPTRANEKERCLLLARVLLGDGPFCRTPNSKGILCRTGIVKESVVGLE